METTWYIWLSVFSVTLPLMGAVRGLCLRKRLIINPKMKYDVKMFTALIFLMFFVQLVTVIMALNNINTWVINRLFTAAELILFSLIFNFWKKEKKTIPVMITFTAVIILLVNSSYDIYISLFSYTILFMWCVLIIVRFLLGKRIVPYRLLIVLAVMVYSIIGIIAYTVLNENLILYQKVFSGGNIFYNIFLATASGVIYGGFRKTGNSKLPSGSDNVHTVCSGLAGTI